MNLLTERDCARAREDIIHFVVTLVQMRCPLGDLDDVDIGDAALASRNDPLNVAERAFNRLGSISIVGPRVFSLLFCVSSHPRQSEIVAFRL